MAQQAPPHVLDITDISHAAMYDVAQKLATDKDVDELSQDALIKKYLPEIQALSPREFFGRWCEWNGFIGWSGNIFDLVRTLAIQE